MNNTVQALRHNFCLSFRVKVKSFKKLFPLRCRFKKQKSTCVKLLLMKNFMRNIANVYWDLLINMFIENICLVDGLVVNILIFKKFKTDLVSVWFSLRTTWRMDLVPSYVLFYSWLPACHSSILYTPINYYYPVNYYCKALHLRWKRHTA